MISVQGEFANRAAARRAVAALVEAGIPEDRIRLWNILPTGESPPAREDSAIRGAGIGGLLGGVPGLAAGAALGAARDSDTDASRRLPEPSGVRIVVDTDAAGPDAASLLRAAGAANVHPNPP